MIITIDGPTASGKTFVAWALAKKLGFCALNSGRFYRALGYVLLQSKHLAPEQFLQLSACQLQEAFAQLSYTYNPAQLNFDVIFEGHIINDFLKDASIDNAASHVSMHPAVRDLINGIQRAVVHECGNIVVEGRDAGSVVFPQAEIKIFLTAALDVRAKRWLHDQHMRGNPISFDQAVQQISQRDERDSERDVAPLVVPEGAYVFDNSAYAQEETVDRLFEYIKNFSL